jgi:choline dehydrogenase-like flavoprotein
MTKNSGYIRQFSEVATQAKIRESADVVIVGTGAAGATAARVLSEAGLEVVMLEEGPLVDPSELRSDLYSSLKRSWRDMGALWAKDKAFLPILQGIGIGGSTAINGAIIHRLPEKIFDIWHQDYGITEPISYAALERVWDIMERELFVAPGPEEILGENNRLMRQGAQAYGIRSNVIRRNVRGCEGSAHCLQGCPNARRQSMDVSYIPQAVACGARIYADCKAERIFAKNGRVAGVRGQFRDPRLGRVGPQIEVLARQAVIVAASAIQTPLLLQASGIGKQSGLVGQRFQAHPGTAVVGYFPQSVKMWFGATQGYETTHFWEQRMKFETLALPLELGAIRLPFIGPALMEILSDYEHIAQWAVQIRAKALGRVKKGLLGRPVIRYGLTDEDVRTLKQGLKHLTRMMFGAGASKVFPGVYGLPEQIHSPAELDPAIDHLPDDPRLFHCIATHIFGTAIMGNDPRTSVVNSSGESHELPGLYVADSSCFPTNLGVNPQHAVCGLAWLIAEGIAARPRQ